MAEDLRGLFEHEWRILGAAIGTITRRNVRESLAEEMSQLIQRKYATLSGRQHPYDWKEWRKLCNLEI